MKYILPILLFINSLSCFSQEINDGIWIQEKDSLSGIEIKNGKLMMYYKGKPTDSTDIYNYTVTEQLPEYANTELKSGKFLILTNNSDTLTYEILGYTKERLTLMYFPRGNVHIFRAEK